MNILVTGGNGFIGSNLVKKLLAEGHDVRCLVHRSRERLENLPVTLIDGRLENASEWREQLRGVSLVFHLAARASDWGKREAFFRINAEGTKNLLEAAESTGVKRFVFLSSLAVHSFTGHVDADEQTPANQIRYPYGASKVVAERFVREAKDRGKMECVIVRPGLVIFGPEDTTSFVHMAPLLEKGRWTHVAGGRPLLCYSYVENLVHGLLLAGIHPAASGETFVITDDLKISWREFVSAVISAFGVPERILSVPIPVARAAGCVLEWACNLFGKADPPPITDYRTALVSRDLHFTCGKAKKVLGYHPPIEFKEGLRRTVEWYHRYKGIR
jgi:nucleoside-diphosphate-sugar epimerase